MDPTDDMRKHFQPDGSPARESHPDVKVTVLDGGQSVICETDIQIFELTAQEAYDLWCALHNVLPQLHQPFQPYPR